MAVPKFITNDMKGGYVGGPTTPARRCYVGGTLVYQGFGPASEQEFIEQTAPGGPAKLLKVYGKTIVNNQLVNPSYWPSGTNSGITFTNNGDGTYTANGTAINLAYLTEISTVYVTQGHKYLILGADSDNAFKFNIYSPTQFGSAGINAPAIVQPTASGLIANFRIIVSAGKTVNNSTIRPLFIDLTTRFGAGNEPTSVDEALRLLGGDAFDPTYDPGSLQSNKTSLLRAYDGGNLRGSLALNLSTLTGKLNGEGASVAVFPDGVEGVGSVRNEVAGITAAKRLITLNLGNLSWSANHATHRFVASYGLKEYASSQKANALCSKFETATVNEVLANTKSCFGIGYLGSISISDIGYETMTGAQFKAAMAGVMMVAELATPLTYTLDTPLPTDLTCEQGDILQRVSDNNCPFVGEMKFGL